LPGHLSGGQQQRVALARALAPSPGLLLLDEPLSALDAKVRLHLRQQIKDLQHRLNLTTIMVTHDQEEALTMADRIVVMNHGVIEQIGSPADIYLRPASLFVADFVGKMNFFPARAHAQGMLSVGTLTLPAPAGAGDGDLTLCFRPEEVQVRSGGIEGADAWVAHVASIEYLGSAWRASLDCPALGTQRVIADFSSADARRFDLRAGRELRVTVAPEHLHTFRAADRAAP
jgi:iron(III) transport system ATP-binding protein